MQPNRLNLINGIALNKKHLKENKKLEKKQAFVTKTKDAR